MASAPHGFATLEAASDAIAAYNPHRRRPGNFDGLRKDLRQHDDGGVVLGTGIWDPASLRITSKP
ncbi:hypothetical protein J7I84_01490 [Arthrobacter sp. ISL-85]|uniref:hypothetical protein n=1 Tax=Arthrobacter sp. ISL-85 TaxID=2819115 RepID=UPI001BED2FAB|nr:hypothetical protein [Arthrobacter sp. ISL-85]MBT2565181.1 hypothetical protein [Arthrobacter sp. ISL-85]